MNLFHYYGEEGQAHMEKYSKVQLIYGQLQWRACGEGAAILSEVVDVQSQFPVQHWCTLLG